MAGLESVRWNDEARSKILSDADNVLRDAVSAVAREFTGTSWEDAFRALNERLKERFIDYEPGPDVRKYAEAIAAGDYT
ncbi:hypothetical protein [Frondihabitans australicus]|uniref:Uncharacterized protein n=1 Tax=Frondihabitans australicus TaxID=386892 RepID=A0A495IH78_9MICO|nr:hypothetical protein [Frondihabitans australicus]RKR74798.1 hypothetical protein C8E83_1928 [Frondihabitans australicus]